MKKAILVAALGALALSGQVIAADKGETTYKTTCFACHGAGIAGAPKFGDKAAWAPRIKQGNDTLYTHALKGFSSKPGSTMLPKGGNPSLADADVKAAVDYMVKAAK
jgi:cytochrome c5